MLVALLYAALFAFGCTCPIKWILGISCPGCGMTRACISAARLDFESAFAYHPLWIALLPYAVVYLLLVWKRKEKELRVWTIGGAMLMVGIYIWRMYASVNDVVVFEPQNGLVGRMLGAIFGKTPNDFGFV